MLAKNVIVRSALLAMAMGAAAACGSDEPAGSSGMSGGGTGGLGGAGGLGGTGGTTGGVGGTTGGTGGTGVVAGMSGGTGVVAGMTGGTMAGGGSGGMMAGSGGATGGMGGMDPDAGMTGGTGGMMGDGDCCPDGNCLCYTEPPADHTLDDGPIENDYYDLSGVGCVYHPTGDGPYAAVAISDGFTGTGGCGSFMTGGWGPFLASYGIVVLNVEVPSCCVAERGDALTAGIQALKDENADSGSPLFGKLAGRYGVMGFSMGGGGSTLAASDDPSLLSSIPIMSHQPVGSGVTVPTLFTCGSGDSAAFGGCGGFGMPAFQAMPADVPKGIFTVQSGHSGQPTSGSQGLYVLPFQKVFLEGDERWRPLVLSAPYDDSANLE